MRPMVNWLIGAGLCASVAVAVAETPDAPQRTFATSFESIADFSGFYIVPQGHMGTSWHEQSRERVQGGLCSHKAWVQGANPPSSLFINNNHRAYPTIQFQKTPSGVFNGPVEIEFRVWLDMPLKARKGENEWVSFATFSDDPTNAWKRTVLVNLSWDGRLHLMHVPRQGMQEYLYQNTTLKFPQRQWVHVRVFLDTHATNGYAKVWQDGVLVSHARITDMNGTLAQAHFGLYAAPSISRGVIFNDDLVIREVSSETADRETVED